MHIWVRTVRYELDMTTGDYSHIKAGDPHQAVDDKPMLRGRELPKLIHGRLDIVLSSAALNILALALPILLLQVYDRIIPNNAKETLFLLVFGVGTALIIESGLKLGRSYLTARAGARFEHIASCRALGRTLGTSIDAFEKDATGAYLHRFSAVEILREFMSGQSLLIFIDLPFAVIFLGMIGYIGGSLVFVPLALLLLFTLVTFLVGSGLRAALDSQTVWDDRRYNFLIEVLTGIHTLKGLALESQMIRRYERLQESSATSVRDVSFRNNIAQGLGVVFSQITLILVAAFGSILVINEAMTVGGLAACTLLAGRALQPLLRAMGVWTHFQNIKIAKRRINKLLHLPQEKEQAGTAEIDDIKGVIEFDDVHFSYQQSEDSLFEGVSFKAEPGTITAFSGTNGSGKSSLLWLAMGLARPNKGTVHIDGRDISELDPAQIRRAFAYLPQNGIVFHGTIMENLTMFRRGDIVDEAVEFAKLLGLDSVIKKMPHGYDTVVGDGAAEGLPGGIRQRIAIARALLGKPKIILFDEANTSLDMAGDDILKQALLSLKSDCTMLLVSHRPSLVRVAEHHYRISNKKVEKVEQTGKGASTK